MTPRDLLEPYEPSAANPFNLQKAGHLLRRASFGGSLADREELVRIGVEDAVDRMSQEGPGEDVDAAFQDVVAMGEIRQVRAYRFWRMLTGRRRLRERMSFFWHTHFATSNQKVKNPPMMAHQMAMFDRLGLGTFDDLVLAVSRDPAMVRWLDNDTNVKGRANENYARELFELFALGRGNSHGRPDPPERRRGHFLGKPSIPRVELPWPSIRAGQVELKIRGS